MSFGEVRSSNALPVPPVAHAQVRMRGIDQFGTSGCVGCGRCITWCPVGIDVTEEIAAIRMTDGEVRVAEEVLA